MPPLSPALVRMLLIIAALFVAVQYFRGELDALLGKDER